MDPDKIFLLLQSIDFLLTIVNNRDLLNILLQPLIKLGLPNLVISLLAGEISKLGDGRMPERYSSNFLLSVPKERNAFIFSFTISWLLSLFYFLS